MHWKKLFTLKHDRIQMKWKRNQQILIVWNWYYVASIIGMCHCDGFKIEDAIATKTIAYK